MSGIAHHWGGRGNFWNSLSVGRRRDCYLIYSIPISGKGKEDMMSGIAHHISGEKDKMSWIAHQWEGRWTLKNGLWRGINPGVNLLLIPNYGIEYTVLKCDVIKFSFLFFVVVYVFVFVFCCISAFSWPYFSRTWWKTLTHQIWHELVHMVAWSHEYLISPIEMSVNWPGS